MSDDGVLREKAREAIRVGKLPGRPPDRIWGGPGTGAQCAVCRGVVRRDELGLEIEFIRDDSGQITYHVHIRCLSALESVHRDLEVARGPILPSGLGPIDNRGLPG